MNEWTLQLPFTKPLSLNDRQHHMVKAKAVREWRESTALLARAAGIPACDRIRATLLYVPNANRRRDPDNLVAGFKPAVDALVDAGIVPDDTQEYVERVWPQILNADPKHEGGRLYLRIEDLS